MKIITWNVNSIRVRLARCLALLERHQPDVVALQETKVVDEAFPEEDFERAGYRCHVHGQKTYNGVAILVRQELDGHEFARGIPDGEEDPAARVLGVEVEGVRILDLYVPNGSSVTSEKFPAKLHWLDRLQRWLDRELDPAKDWVVLGDFNIAPEDRDVHDPDAWRGQVLFHPDEHAALGRLLALGLTDAFRTLHEESGQYTWWDFRGGKFWKNEGLRIDHLLITRSLAERLEAVEIDRWERKGKQPSDHAPVLATFTARPDREGDSGRPSGNSEEGR